MGCSPSKGQLFTGAYNHRDEAQQFGSETDMASGGLGLSQEENPGVHLQGKINPTVGESVDIAETNMHLVTKTPSEENAERKDERRIQNHGCKKSKEKERLRKTVYMQSNSDPSQAITEAHEAAYAYMTYNIPKFESLLGLLEKAAQTQVSLQPVVALLALQYEEINQTLEEIASEGEQMLGMYRSHRVLPAAQDDVSHNPDTPEAERSSGTESSPDLLHHMLHRLIQEMRLVGDSVKELGDTSFEETSTYFNSVSQLLAGKLEEKRAAEIRLKQVLDCVESYALRNLDSVDTALPSEDSGIGVENESHNGSVRRCSHRKSAGSGVTLQSSYGCADDSLPDQVCGIGDEDDDAPLQANLESKEPTNSTFKQNDQTEKTIRRSKSADDPSVHTPSRLWGGLRSRSAGCLGKGMNDCMVQQKNGPNDKQTPEWTTKGQDPPQFCHLKDGNKGPLKPGLIPSLTPAVAPLPPGKNAVKRLINTFSQGVCDIPDQKPTKFKGKKKRFLPVMTECKEDVSSSGKNATKSYPPDQQVSVRPSNVDLTSLPPPPPEVLMDNSFKKKDPAAKKNGSETTNSIVFLDSQCLRATMSTVPRPRQDTLNISETSPNGRDLLNGSHQKQDCDQSVEAEDKDEAIGLRLRFQTIDHLSHSTDVLARLGPGDAGHDKCLAESGEETVRDSGEGEASTLCSNGRRPTTPPVSRARIPPSSYSASHRVPNPTILPPSTSDPLSVQDETSKASITSQIQRRTRKDSEGENGFKTAPRTKSFRDARSVFCDENQSAFQSVKPSCRSTLPRPWGEHKISRERVQETCVPQTIRRSIPYGSTLTDHQLMLTGQDSESTT